MVSEAVKQIHDALFLYQSSGKSLCITSSFQTHSLPLLHIVTRALPDIPVLFIDTGFHFPETYAFRNELEKAWGLNVHNLTSETTKVQQMDNEGKFLYSSDPEYCCHLNKVVPLNKEVEKYDVWIAGLRRDQTSFRKGLEDEVLQPNGQLKYHPILEWNSKMIYEYRKMHELPTHPLEAKGYLSIGCQPCTHSAIEDAERNGRWYGSKKSECGIHLNTDK